jgi:hypothetical protein
VEQEKKQKTVVKRDSATPARKNQLQ